MVSHISSFENNKYNTFLRSTSTTMTTTTNTFRDNETTKKKIDTLLDDIINEDNERIANDDHLLFESSNRSFTLTQLHDSSGSFHHHRSKKHQQPPQPTRRGGWNGSCRSFVASSEHGEISNSSNGSEMLLIDDTSIPSILPPHTRKSDTRRLLSLGNNSTSTLPQIHETTKLSKCHHHHEQLDTSLLGLLKNSGNETLEITTDLMNPKRINKAVSLRQHAVYSRTKSNESIPNDTTTSASSNQRIKASSKFENNNKNTLNNNLSGSLASSSTAVTSTADLERCDSSRFRHSFTSSTSNHHNNIPKHHNDRLHHSMSALKVVPTTTTKGSTISSSHNNGCEHPDYATNKKITSLNMFLTHSSNRPGKKNTTIKHSFPLDVSDRCSVSSISYTSYDDSEDVSASSIYDDHPETIHEVSTTSLLYSFPSTGQQYRTSKNKLPPSSLSSVSGGLHRSVSCLPSRCLSPIRTGGVHRSVPTTTTTTTTTMTSSSSPSSSSPSSAERNLLRRGSYDSAPKLPNRFRSPARSIATTATDDSKK